MWIPVAIIAIAVVLLIANHDGGTIFGMADNQFAGLLYAAILVSVISAGMIRRQGGLGKAARNAAIWVLIILVLMTGYIFRYDLQDFGSRLSAGLIPGSPVSTMSVDGRSQVMLVRSRNGHFEAEGTLDGSPARFMVDTGASTVVLTHALAQSAGIDTGALSYTVPVMTANGRALAARVTVGRLEIGKIVRERVPALIAQEGRLSTSLLGMSYLDTLSGFEIRGDRLILTD
jgi:aspartyl protease family protein